MFVRYYQITLFYEDFFIDIGDLKKISQYCEQLYFFMLKLQWHKFTMDIDQKGDMILESNYRLMELEVTVSYKC